MSRRDPKLIAFAFAFLLMLAYNVVLNHDQKSLKESLRVAEQRVEVLTRELARVREAPSSEPEIEQR